MTIVCRKWREPETEEIVDADDRWVAPDAYAHEFVRMKTGDRVFIEVRQEDESWIPWEVVCVFDGQGYLSAPVSDEEVEEALRRSP